jgi:competence protein ComFA
VTAEGKLLYLSATPPAHLRKELVAAEGGTISLQSPTHVLLPKRYHGNPLPVPRVVIIPRLSEKLRSGRKIASIIDSISQSLQQHRQVFVFVPRIEVVALVLRYLQAWLPAYAALFAGVHAADPDREQKVLRFRAKTYLLLVTTTILERGVTIPRSDVIVLGADAPVFDEASLVQIAGRVGRSADSPSGTVLFFGNHRTKAPFLAVKQIQNMNRLAEKIGAAADADAE